MRSRNLEKLGRSLGSCSTLRTASYRTTSVPRSVSTTAPASRARPSAASGLASMSSRDSAMLPLMFALQHCGGATRAQALRAGVCARPRLHSGDAAGARAPDGVDSRSSQEDRVMKYGFGVSLLTMWAAGCQIQSSSTGDPAPGDTLVPPSNQGSGVVPGGPTTGPIGPLGPTTVVTAARPPVPISGGTLLITRDGMRAVAADPDRDRVSIVDLKHQAVLH